MTNASTRSEIDALPGDTTLLLKVWNRRIVIALDAHYDAARHCARRNYLIGIPAVVLATIVGSAVFATLERDVQLETRILVGLLSIASAVLSALQTFLSYSDRAESHRITGARYSAIARDIEQLLTMKADAIDNPELINSVRERLDSLAEEAPGLSDRLWAKARARHLNET